MRSSTLTIAAAAVVAGAVCLLAAQTTPEAAVQAITASAGFADAMAALDRDHDRIVSDIIRLTEIPAPPFKEAARGAALLAAFRGLPLTDVEQDAEGNVLGLRRGSGGGPLIAIAAHLDTVFPEGTSVKVRREGTKLYAPGVGDDTRSLAVLLGLIRALDAAKVQTTGDILFVADVGEEGPGDLRGMKFLFQKGRYKGRISAFITIDDVGLGTDVVNGAVGSKRYRVTFKGPGGHSYGAFGLVNPAFAMASAMKAFGALRVPASPKTTYSVGLVGGGTSVNSIPVETWMEVDMRSESPAELAKAEKAFLALIPPAVGEENATRSTAQGAVSADVKLIGDRPSGETPKESAIVRTAEAAVRAAGLTPRLSFGSNDANLPIGLGIPAIRLNSGGTGGRSHALEEWIDVEKSASLRGIRVVMATLLALAGVR